MNLVDALSAEFAHGAQATRNDLQATPDDRFDWQPHEKSMPLRRLARLIMNHTAHHRGQLSVNLRLLGAPLPSVYGPTADSSGF